MQEKVEYSFIAIGDIADFIADPLLILKKFPDVDTIEKISANEYVVNHNGIRITNTEIYPNVCRCVFEEDIGDIIWRRADTPVTNVNSVSVGRVEDNGDGTITVSGSLCVKVDGVNPARLPWIKPIIMKVEEQMVLAFKNNIENAVFENTIPA